MRDFFKGSEGWRWGSSRWPKTWLRRDHEQGSNAVEKPFPWRKSTCAQNTERWFSAVDWPCKRVSQEQAWTNQSCTSETELRLRLGEGETVNNLFADLKLALRGPLLDVVHGGSDCCQELLALYKEQGATDAMMDSVATRMLDWFFYLRGLKFSHQDPEGRSSRRWLTPT